MDPADVIANGIGGMLVIIMFSANWTIMEKAGVPGWSVFVPIYGAVKRCQIAGYSGWLILLTPLAIPLILINYSLMRKFDYDRVTSVVGAIFPFIGLTMAAYSDAAYSPYDPPSKKWPPLQTYEAEIISRLERKHHVDDISWDLLARTSNLTRREIVDYIEVLRSPMSYATTR